jgi:hypothetical protein
VQCRKVSITGYSLLRTSVTSPGTVITKNSLTRVSKCPGLMMLDNMAESNHTSIWFSPGTPRNESEIIVQ